MALRPLFAMSMLVFFGAALPAHAEVTISERAHEIQGGVGGCADAAGDYVVVWDSGKDPQRTDARVLARRIDHDGGALGPEIAVSSSGGGQHDPSVACQPDGSFLVVWTDDAAGHVVGRFFDMQGMPLAPEFVVNEVDAPPLASVGVCALSGGAYLAAWQSAAHPSSLQVRRFTTAGPASGELGVDAGGSAVANGQLACNATGEIVLAWRDLTAGAERVQRLDGTPALVGADFVLDTSPDPGVVVQGVAVTPAGWLLAQWIAPATPKLPVARTYFLAGAPGVPRAASFHLHETAYPDRLPLPGITSDSAVFSVVKGVPSWSFVEGILFFGDPDLNGRQMSIASPREKRAPAAVVVGADDEILVVLAQAGGVSQLFGRLFNLRREHCSPVPLTGCYDAEHASLVVNDVGGENDRILWKASPVSGGPAARQVVSEHVLCTYDYSGSVPHLALELGSAVIDTCGLHVDSPCWKVTRRGGLRLKRASVITVDPTRVSFGQGRFAFLPGPVSASRYFDMNPRVTVQMANGRGECWSTDFASAQKNTASGFRSVH